jgi:hypothetical protein
LSENEADAKNTTDMKLCVILRTITTVALSWLAIDRTYAQRPDPKTVEMSYREKNDFAEALLPVPNDAVFKMEGYYLWDPSLIQVGDTYHLFTSRWPEAGGPSGWKKSQVIRASSKSMFGPYKFEEVVLDPSMHPWAKEGIHNPKITKVGNRYLIYHIGIPGYVTGFAFADNIEGPWKPVDKPVIPTNNPSLLIRKDGSAYAVGKFKPKPPKDGGVDDYMNAYEAKHFEGPYTLVGDTLSRLPYNFELEDPTIWWANNQYNVLCMDWESKATGIMKAFTLYTSKDGINYKLYSNIPVWHRNEPVPLADGTSIKVTRLERPQVYLDDRGAVQALLASAQPEDRNKPWFIIIRPVKHFVPKNN